jgi:hypothetical protein
MGPDRDETQQCEDGAHSRREVGNPCDRSLVGEDQRDEVENPDRNTERRHRVEEEDDPD